MKTFPPASPRGLTRNSDWICLDADVDNGCGMSSSRNHPQVASINLYFENHKLWAALTINTKFMEFFGVTLSEFYRDLKPENFLFLSKDESSPLKATDYGLSAYFQPGQLFSDVVGSAYYVAPEVLRRNYGQEAVSWYYYSSVFSL